MTKNRKNIILFESFVILSLLFLEWVVGTYYNINSLTIITYVVYLFVIFCFDSGFVVEYSWMVLMISLNVLGVYICDTMDLYLVELFKQSYYANALAPLEICYVLFFTFLWMFRRSKYGEKKLEKQDLNYINNTYISYCFVIVGICLVLFLFLRIINKPYFSVGVTKEVYAYRYMTLWEKKLKSYLVMFAPIILCYTRCTGKKIYGALFFGLVFIYHIWTGEKFGALFLLIYIIILSLAIDIPEKKKKTIVIFIGGIFVLLLAVVYCQQYLLYGSGIEVFKVYLFNRLSQQGEVWWSVYAQQKYMSAHFETFWQELAAIFPIKYDGLVGQWKMMVEASPHETVFTRAVNGRPYTATTPATLYYYFKFPGMIVFYTIMGYVYMRIVTGLSAALKNNRVLEGILAVKVMALSHDLFNASDLYIISIKGAMYLLMLIVVVYLRKKNKRIMLRKKV